MNENIAHSGVRALAAIMIMLASMSLAAQATAAV